MKHPKPAPSRASIDAGSRVRILRGPYAGQTATVDAVFLPHGAEPSRVLVSGMSGAPHVIESLPLDDVEVVR